MLWPFCSFEYIQSYLSFLALVKYPPKSSIIFFSKKKKRKPKKESVPVYIYQARVLTCVATRTLETDPQFKNSASAGCVPIKSFQSYKKKKKKENIFFYLKGKKTTTKTGQYKEGKLWYKLVHQLWSRLPTSTLLNNDIPYSYQTKKTKQNKKQKKLTYSIDELNF